MDMKHHLPLMQVLKKLKHYERQIIVDHLDDKACRSLKKCLQTVLKQGKKVPEKERSKLTRCFRRHKPLFTKLLAGSGAGFGDKRTLARLGGNPLALILSTAIPLLLDLFHK